MIGPEIQDETLRSLLHISGLHASQQWDPNRDRLIFRVSNGAVWFALELGATYEQWKIAICHLVELRAMSESLQKKE